MMFVNQASDPIVERVLVPDMVLKIAERFAVEENKRVLVLMTDMTAYADALKEIGISMERVPSNRGYIGDLYSQLAVRYERACSYRGAGSVTILTVTTMPGNDVTHPVPDNTGYITEISPAGDIVRAVKMPDRYPTNICFGGVDMRTAYITLSDSGQLGVMQWPDPGLKLNFN